MLRVPAYDLGPINVFNFRDWEWNESQIIENITKMLSCAEVYGLRVRSISIRNKEEKDHSEIKKTKCKILDILLTYTNEEGTEEVNLSYDLPWPVNNHFFIGGNYKICILQLFDKPVIKRKNLIKIRTNIQSVAVELKSSTRKKYNFEVSLFGKKFPFAKLLIAYYGVAGSKTKFNIDENNEYVGPTVSEDVNSLIVDIVKILGDATIDKVRLVEEYFPRKTDAKIIEDVLLITKIDIFSKKFFVTDNIIEEFVNVITNGTYDDTDYANKRIRFVEQVIYSNLTKDFYNLINSIRKNRKVKFSVNSKGILSTVNVSSIVQFDNSLNPLSELAMLTRTSISGPGGFEKANVPLSLREIHPTMTYLTDPSDTADREGCGTIQYVVPNVEFGEDGSFFSRERKTINSVSVSFVPFLEHDDPTRLQMASSQQRHAIMLKKFDLALIQSGVEGMYSDKTSFIFKAKRNGKVIFLNEEVITVQYDNKLCEAFHIGYRKLYISTVDFYKLYYNVGDTFNAGDVIAESNYMTNSRITLGKNCLTCITPWYGYNYEDGIVISEKIANEDYFTSMHYVDLVIDINPNKVMLNLGEDYHNYSPLPEIGQVLNKGDVYVKLKTIDTDGFEDVLFEPIMEETVPENCKIVDIKIYANKWNKSFPQYDQYIVDMVKKQKSKKDEISKKLANYLSKDELDKIMDTLEINQSEKNNFKMKGDFIDGLRIEITATYERKITVGDKIGNRHGNKGIVSKIVPVDQMPILPDGRRAEIIINPLGIVSRMNVGQVFECHLAMSFMDLKAKIRLMAEEGKTAKEIYSYVLEYIKLIDKTENHNYYDQMKTMFDNLPIKHFIDGLHNFFLIQPPFESVKWDDLNAAMLYTNTPYEYDIFDPISQKKIENQVNCGYMYFMKLNHIAQDKMSYRGIGPYSAKTSQPLGGKSRKGGQRLGEMEIWSVIGHGAEKNLNEFITTKSDSIKLRNKYISEMMGNTELLLDSDDDEVPQSLRLLQTNLKSIGLDYELYENGIVHSSDVPEPDDDVDTDSALENLKRILALGDAPTEGSPDSELVVEEPVSLSGLSGLSSLTMGTSFGDKKIVYDEALLEPEDDALLGSLDAEGEDTDE